MKGKFVAVLLISIVLGNLGANTSSSGAFEMPFEDLRLSYDVHMPVIGVYPLSYFNGIIDYVFANVTSRSSGVQAILDGTVTTSWGSRRVVLAQTAICPVGVDTMLYLRPGSNPSKEREVNVTGVRLQVDGGQIYFEGTFSYEGNSSVTTSLGTFETYRFRSDSRVVSGPVSNFNVTTRLNYDKLSKIMLYAEMEARSGTYAYYYSMMLRETNARLVGTSKCLVATAMYGSPFHTIVQELRRFRDHLVVETRVGSAFIQAFNSWYYGFSPFVAEAERESEPLRMGIRAALLPMLVALAITRSLYLTLPFPPEFKILVAGLAAWGLIISLYTGPLLAIVFSFARWAKHAVKKDPR